jgi:hypothetical protein
VSGNHSRLKGHNYETAFCRSLRSRGFKAVTSRSQNKWLDAQGVDIVTDAPFNFQLKRAERVSPPADILEAMPTDKTRVLVHKRDQKPATVTMFLEDFILLWL